MTSCRRMWEHTMPFGTHCPLGKSRLCLKLAIGSEIIPSPSSKFSILELEDAVEVFQRINQGGKRLTRFELVAANCWSESFDLAKSVRDFNERVKQRTDFGRVEPITFVQAMSLVEYGGCKTEHELRLKARRSRNYGPVSRKQSVMRSIGCATTTESSGTDMMPYDAMLAVLTCYFSEHGTTNRPART